MKTSESKRERKEFAPRSVKNSVSVDEIERVRSEKLKKIDDLKADCETKDA